MQGSVRPPRTALLQSSETYAPSYVPPATSGTPLMMAPTYIAKDIGTYASPPVTTTPTYIARDTGVAARAPVTYRTIEETMVVSEPAISLLKRCLCELLGTLALFFVVVLCSSASYFYIAFFYVALIYAFYSCSGAHLNPAISFAMFLARRMPLQTFFAYIISQILGCVIGGLLFRCIFYGSKLTVTVVPASSYTLTDALVVQFVYTLMLIFVALNALRTPGRDQFFGIAIGFVILAGGSAAYVISNGAYFNPALCVGLMLGSFEIGACLWYILAELIGAIIGVLLFHLCRYESSSYGSIDYPTGSAILSELFGTFWFVFTVCLNVGLDTGYSSLAGGGSLVSLIYAFGHPGGYFNPAVTLALMGSGRNTFSRRHGWWYIVIQLVAGILAGILAHYTSKATGLYTASSSYGWLPIAFVEFLFTLALTYVVVVMTTEIPFQHDFLHALAIGFTFLGSSAAAYSISGGYLNPALALGFLVDGQPNFSSCLSAVWYYLTGFYYWIPEIFGAVVAALLWRWIYFKEDHIYSTPVVGAFATIPNKSAAFVETSSRPFESITTAAPMSLPAESMLSRLPATTGSISSGYASTSLIV